MNWVRIEHVKDRTGPWHNCDWNAGDRHFKAAHDLLSEAIEPSPWDVRSEGSTGSGAAGTRPWSN